MPDEIPEFEFEAGIAISNLLKDAGLVNSTSDAIRMIKQGAAKQDGGKIEMLSSFQLRALMFTKLVSANLHGNCEIICCISNISACRLLLCLRMQYV